VLTLNSAGKWYFRRPGELATKQAALHNINNNSNKYATTLKIQKNTQAQLHQCSQQHKNARI